MITWKFPGLTDTGELMRITDGLTIGPDGVERYTLWREGEPWIMGILRDSEAVRAVVQADAGEQLAKDIISLTVSRFDDLPYRTVDGFTF